MDADKYIGRLLDNRYEILEVIGTGGMAVVYKARCHRLNRLVAIKILKDEYSQDEEFRRRFHAESQAVAMFSHPNIVSIYDVSSSDEADYIVMELIDGITLKQYMEKKGILNWKETLHFSIQIAKALEHAHSRGIVHRDIKPHNVMVLKNGSVKVADFGIARIMSKGNTLTKEALGSVHYISPEQAKGGRVDNRSDIYSLGVVMYEMMSGRPPYDGESPVAVAIQHINGGAPMPSTFNPNIPGGLEQIIMKAMALNPSDRYNSATAMLYDMDEFRKDPTILFDYNVPPLDEATRVQNHESQSRQPMTTAERMADRRGEQPRPRQGGSASGGQSHSSGGQSRASGSQSHTGHTPDRSSSREAAARRRREEQEAEEESRNRVTTIAIVACSIVVVLAIAVFLIVFFGRGSGDSELVQVPLLLGETYDSEKDYGDIRVSVRERMYSDTYEEMQIMDQSPRAGDMVEKGSIVYVDVSLGLEPSTDGNRMQKLEGVRLEDARSFLERMDLRLNILPREENSPLASGLVTRTEPAEGTELTEGQTVTLWVSNGKMPMPNVEGLDIDEAKEALEEAGFVRIEEKPVSSEKKEGIVVHQSVRANAVVDTSTTIQLDVSDGTVKKVVPNVVGRDIDTARQMLKASGFNNVRQEYVESDLPEDTVVRQSASNIELDVTEEIILEVSEGPTEPPTSEPTQPKPTTKRVQIYLGEGREACKLIIRQGGTVIVEVDVPKGQTNVTVELMGTGQQYYEVWVDDVRINENLMVDFSTP